MLAAEITRFLETSPPFCGLSERALADVAAKALVQRFQPGEMVVWQGEPSATVYLLTSGIAAVTLLTAAGRQSRTLAYLMPGESFGEVGILENQPRSASVVALTDITVLAFERDDFLGILGRYPSVAIEVARLLGHYLVESDRRQTQGADGSRLILVFDLGASVDVVRLGHVLAATLARKLSQPTAYTEYPDPSRLADDATARPRPEGYDIFLCAEDLTLPGGVRATLLLDQLLSQYRNAVVALPAAADANCPVLLERAAHFILLAPPTAEGRRRLQQLRADLARYTASGRAGLSTIVALDGVSSPDQSTLDEADYVLQSLAAEPPAEATVAAIETLIDRIDRSHQIAVYIPTTIAVDQAADTSAYVQRTLELLGARFGGATNKPARGVWRSDTAGLVGETVHLVETYASEADLNAYLDEVVDYIKGLKRELQQEAMALEVDQKLILI